MKRATFIRIGESKCKDFRKESLGKRKKKGVGEKKKWGARKKASSRHVGRGESVELESSRKKKNRLGRGIAGKKKKKKGTTTNAGEVASSKREAKGGGSPSKQKGPSHKSRMCREKGEIEGGKKRAVLQISGGKSSAGSWGADLNRRREKKGKSGGGMKDKGCIYRQYKVFTGESVTAWNTGKKQGGKKGSC